jgi:hypothetical protein
LLRDVVDRDRCGDDVLCFRTRGPETAAPEEAPAALDRLDSRKRFIFPVPAAFSAVLAIVLTLAFVVAR